MSVSFAVFASGGGTNLQSLLDTFRDGSVARVALVLSDREGSGALQRAQHAGVATAVVPVAGRERGDVARDTLRVLDAHGVEAVVLAGYLRLVPPEVVRRFAGRMLNVHPALLPAFGGRGMYGMRVHRAVLEAGCTVSGATVHHVDDAYDTGPILAQWPVPVLAGDTIESLAARVLRVEHRILPAAVERLARSLAAAGSDGAGGAAAPGADAAPRPDRAFRLTDDPAPTPHEVRRALGLQDEGPCPEQS